MRSPQWVIAALLLCLSLLSAFTQARRTTGIDFFHLWMVPRVASAGPLVTSPYSKLGREELTRGYFAAAPSSPEERKAAQESLTTDRGTFDVVATPALFGLMRLVSSVEYATARLLWLVLQLGAGLAAGLWLARRVGLAWPSALALTALLYIGFEPLGSDLRVGNVNSLQLGCVVLGVALAESPKRFRVAAGAAVLGAVAVMKPTVAPVLLTLAAVRAARGASARAWISGAFGGMLAAAALGVLGFGARSWVEFFSEVPRLLETGRGLEAGNYAVGESLGSGFVMPVALLALAASFAIGWAIARPRQRAEPQLDDLRAISVALLLVLLISRLVWFHYFVLALPALVLLLRPQAGGLMRAALVWGAPAAALLLLAAWPIPMIVGIEGTPRVHGIESVAAAVLLLSALTFDALVPARKMGAAAAHVEP